MGKSKAMRTNKPKNKTIKSGALFSYTSKGKYMNYPFVNYPMVKKRSNLILVNRIFFIKLETI